MLAPFEAYKKLDWHEPWAGNTKSIEVVINGFVWEKDRLIFHYSYKDDDGKTRFDSDVAEQFSFKENVLLIPQVAAVDKTESVYDACVEDVPLIRRLWGGGKLAEVSEYDIVKIQDFLKKFKDVVKEKFYG